jgi:hypothetical protein
MAKAATTATSRRREVRVRPPESLTVKVAGLRGRQTVKDISINGLCLILAAELAVGSVQGVTMEFGPIMVRRQARAVHTGRQPDGLWAVGLELLDDPSASLWTMDDLISALLAEAAVPWPSMR